MTAKRIDQPERKKASRGGKDPEPAVLALPAGVPLSDSGQPGGNPGRVDLTGTMPEGIRIDPAITEGHPGYNESGSSEFVPPERTMTTMASAQLEMHDDHNHWLSDHSMWRDDLALWQGELDQAFEGLKQLEKALGSHREALQEHLKTIDIQEKGLRKHEHALADYQRGGLGADLKPMAEAHKQRAEKQKKHSAAHERLKKHHHTLMAHWSLLLRSLTEMRL